MTTPIQLVAVANRGEIASRVFATCRRLGIETMAVFSDADADLPFVADADYAARLPGSIPSETYLQGERIVRLVRASGGQAVHPGYGFLSESADFARAVLDGQLVWIGPPPEAIEAMGSKVRSKELMRAAGVPTLEAPAEPTESDLPLLVKASAGGGGRGMRVVRRLDDLGSEVAAAEAEARSAFGDGTVFVEPYVESGRHVEVQVLFDTYGSGVALGDRDCSLQRRHQKVMEEAPAPGLSDEVRAGMHQAAVEAGRAVGYAGAGTVEFLYDPATGRFWFLEMNTRLQVEHPVTECVIGLDLVALQIGVAEGRTLAELLPDGAPAPSGHAVEVRLYAEDPAADWQPTAGRLARFDVPADTSFDLLARHGIRVDAGYASGDVVGTHYDAMLAKVISWGPDRGSALRSLRGALRRARLHGIATNRDLLIAALGDRDTLAGTMTTSTLEHRLAKEFADLAPAGDPDFAPFVAAIALAARDTEQRTVQRGVPTGWRNVVSQPHRTTFLVSGRDEPVVAEWYGDRDGFRSAGEEDLHVIEATPRRVVVERGGFRQSIDVHIDPVTGEVHLDDDSMVRQSLRLLPRFTDPADAVASGSLLAPMPGTVVTVAVEPGDAVAAGDVVLVLEAMKMQHTVTAPHDGTVAEVNVEPGAQVASGEVLAVVATGEPEESP
ncbi:acetyl/propionyl/methylcrotonyl-CoA carboxylase subunit alpha [Nocardioides renjunii]|uniref:acetyl/propionyl/methylcrotonyl-CoA carboxylase subunit alpha n=1 Tax=Nocardioides renjunii TaxID=3095075 RepID=UPI002AFEFBAC|nr:biotin carboxylase N-terminal domain-containing protein [Nocardioides sp. S-34]WQQ22185.1 biotin carboxylase N-terminal domain-containing protein [Nocardioides sp. S-34]